MKGFVLLSLLFASVGLFAQMKADQFKSQLEKEVESVDFQSVKDLIKKDMLLGEVNRKTEIIKEQKKKRESKKINQFFYPTEGDFWNFASEWWLVKNANVLKWDFQKPDYGVDESFKALLEVLGIYEKRFKILLLDSSEITHFVLPAGENEYLYLLSVPFIRTMDLTKLEISILLLEGYFRLKENYFKKYIMDKNLEAMLGSNFHDKKVDTKLMEDIMNKYSEKIFKKGFSFQEQFTVTKKTSNILKSNIRLWSAYYKLLGKIDNLVKTNVFYKNYTKIYPSPEIQINWIRPSNKK